MIYPPDLLDVLQSAAGSAWRGTVYRHMFGSYPPDRSNTSGARWNPPNIAAVYASCERETALAEADYYMSLQPLRPVAKRMLYTIRVSLANVLDLTAADVLAALGVTDDVLSAVDQSRCRTIGGAVSWLGHDGMLIPSARQRGGTNLVIYADAVASDFQVMNREVIAGDEGGSSL